MKHVIGKLIDILAMLALLSALLFGMLLTAPANAQDKITNLRVVCAAGKNPVPFTNPIEADKYAQSRPCSGRTYVEANYYYLSSSSRASSSAKSSSSSSSSSTAPLVSTYGIKCPVSREDGTAMDISEIDHYELIRQNKVEKISPSGCEFNYTTASPAPNEKFNFVTVAKVGGSSKPIEVAQ